MNKAELGIEIHNKEELLRIYENDEKNAVSLNVRIMKYF